MLLGVTRITFSNFVKGSSSITQLSTDQVTFCFLLFLLLLGPLLK